MQKEKVKVERRQQKKIEENVRRLSSASST